MEIYSKTERIILSVLSADSRASITELAKTAKCSRVTVVKALNRLEKRLDIRYTLEIDESKLGGSERHIVVVKFGNKKPSEEFLTSFFKNDEYAQDVYALEGAFDLFIYARAGNPAKYIQWETYIASELAEYRPVIKPSEFVVAHIGFWPLNDSFVNDISSAIKLDKKDRQILVLLNQNSRMSIHEMAKKTGIEKGTVRYRLLRLQNSGVVKRFTIAIQNPPQQYKILHFSNYRFNKNINERMLELRRWYLTIDDGEFPVLGTFQIVAPISGSFRSFAFSLFYDQDNVSSSINNHKKIFQKDNIDIVYARVANVVKGMLPLRNLEIKANYTPIAWNRDNK